MKIFKLARGFFLRGKKPRREKNNISDLDEIERTLAQNRTMIEQTQEALLAETEKIGRLRQIEIDLEKLRNAKGANEKSDKRLRGTKMALNLARQRFDAISERLSEYDHFGTALLVQKIKKIAFNQKRHEK